MAKTKRRVKAKGWTGDGGSALAEAHWEIERLRAETAALWNKWSDAEEKREQAEVRLREAQSQVAEMKAKRDDDGKRILRMEIRLAKVVEALQITRNTIGDLRSGFSRTVDPARWVEGVQAYIDDALATAQPEEGRRPGNVYWPHHICRDADFVEGHCLICGAEFFATQPEEESR